MKNQYTYIFLFICSLSACSIGEQNESFETNPISFKEEKAELPEPCKSEIYFADSRTLFSYANLVIIESNSLYYLTDNQDFSLDFKYKREAELALNIIEFYEFDEYCTIGQDTSFSYFLIAGQIPKESHDLEDCIPHEVCDLSVSLTWSGNYTVVEQLKWHYASPSNEVADKILQTIQYFQSSHGCFVGRPFTKMHYLRR